MSGLLSWTVGAVAERHVLHVEACDAHAGAPVRPHTVGGRLRVHLHDRPVHRVRDLPAVAVELGGAHGHRVQALVDDDRRHAAAVVDVAAEAGGLIEEWPLQTDGVLIAIVAGLVVIAGAHVGVEPATTFHEALHVLHADVVVRLLEDEGRVVGVVVRHRAEATLQRLGGQRFVHQARLHAVPRAQARADHVGPFVGVVAQAARVVDDGHCRGRGEERRRDFDDIADLQRACGNGLAVGREHAVRHWGSRSAWPG